MLAHDNINHHFVLRCPAFAETAEAVTALVDQKSFSEWVVLARNKAALGAIEKDKRWRRLRPDPEASRRTWTDDYSHVLGILRD